MHKKRRLESLNAYLLLEFNQLVLHLKDLHLEGLVFRPQGILLTLFMLAAALIKVATK